LEEAAGAQTTDEAEKARLWAAAGNMWIAANQPGKAALALDKALIGTGLQAEQRGEALLDRARAAEVQNDLKTARSRVAAAAQTISEDPFLWYFSAALAIREGNAPRAKEDINRALSLAPNDQDVLFEAGHVYQFAGETEKARDYWTRSWNANVNSKVGKAAQEALSMLPRQPADGASGPPVKPAPVKPK
jgi:tetratricopeptide (TPR) repeat protein